MIIPTRNRSAMLRRTLATVLSQTRDDIEVVVVDEACEDDTPAFLASVGDPRLRVIRHERARGLASARNSGMAFARGEWSAFCDDDDLWAPYKLEAQLDALGAAPEADWCSCGSVFVDPALRILGYQAPPDPGDVSDQLLSYNTVPGGGSGVLARTRAIRAAGGFDLALAWGEDWDMWTRLAFFGSMASTPRPLVAYQIHGQNMSQHPTRLTANWALIDLKYRPMRAQRGLRLSREILEAAQGDIDIRAGRPRRAARHFLGQALEARSPRPLKQAATALLAPGTMARRRVRRYRAQVPEDRAAEAETWLNPLRVATTLEGSTR
ncbi:MAG TPA: glycosyltransferase family A protein [Acidimicrobiales bacterium]|nr:glycosyltransferase family A protein [Acidimicrobiales bacterium]